MVLGAPISLLKVVFLPSDPKTVFKGQLAVQKRAAWSTPIPLADIKALGRAKGATINDILLTAATGALRRYMQEEGQKKVDGIDMRAIVPVNLRTSNPLPKLGNVFGLVFLALPTGYATPDERLKILKERMNALKRSLQPVALFAALYLLGFFPHLIQNVIMRFFGTKGTAVMTNVPGPRELLYLAGSPIRQIMVWVPQSGRLGLGLSILSYNGQVMIGIATDEQLVPEPERIVRAFHEELELLKK
jgi:WS/DGAT/MGAT family acyltransferase